MIWFYCKQCGKTRGREESASGTLVFCECGYGNRVPWTSTAPEPASPPPVAPPDPMPPRQWQGDDAPAAPDRWRRGRAPVQMDPSRCLNHPDRPRTATCAACREAFCPACVVTLQGRTLCGPCKDYRARAVLRPPKTSALAVISCVMALGVAGPCSFCMPLTAVNGEAEGGLPPGPAVILGIVAAALPLTALILGLLALREIETKPNVSGRPVALTGTIAGGIGVLWCVMVYAAVVIKHGGG
jgi:hypothetical protein